MKRLICMLACSVYVLGLMAQSVSKELATRMAMQYMRHDMCHAAPVDYSLLTKNNLIDTAYTQTFSLTKKAPLYLVQMPDGWVLVASEYVSTPILASSPTGQFLDTIDMPDGLKWLLSYYEDAMQYVHNHASQNDSIRQTWEHLYNSDNINNKSASSLPSSYEIDSIRSFRWNQNGNNTSSYTAYCDKVYDKFCPTWYTPTSCDYTYVGCTAVAMGIVMRYYKWPYSAAIPDSIDSLANISTEKHLVLYHWNNMPGAIYNSTDVSKVDEIAGFLRDCGYAAKMKYGEKSSSASLNKAENAMEDNFHYANMTHRQRKWYVGNWINKLKTEIAADRPVIYAGYDSDDRGHAFVLYGYTSENKFVINWGWGNSNANNGFYSLDSLAPTGHDYTEDHEAIWGITPDYPSCNAPYTLQQSDVNSEYFEIYEGGTITASNITINHNRSGVIYSGESVTLTSSFQIEVGAEVYIDVKDMHCNDDRSESIDENMPDIYYAPQKQSTIATPSATKLLHNGQILIIRNDKTYTITGQRVE